MARRRAQPKLDPDQIATISIWYDVRLPEDEQITVDVGDLDMARASWLLREAAEQIDQVDVCPPITVIAHGTTIRPFPTTTEDQ
jgi:hypothetical protein